MGGIRQRDIGWLSENFKADMQNFPARLGIRAKAKPGSSNRRSPPNTLNTRKKDLQPES
jgi:hypothetical protein